MAGPAIIDTHAHAWDAACRHVEGTGYRPAAVAPFERLAELWSAHGVGAGVLVQPSFLGADNGYLLARLEAHPDRLRGVIIAEPERDRADIGRLHALGVRAFRFNLISGGPLPDLALPAWRRFGRDAADRGWHVVLAGSSSQLLAASRPALDLGLPLVLDHFAMPDPKSGARCPDWRRLLDLAGDTGRIWLKASGPYRLGGLDPADLWPAIRERLPPDRLMWGSDWPWTRHEDGRSFPEVLRSPFQGLDADAARTARHIAPALLYGL